MAAIRLDQRLARYMGEFLAHPGCSKRTAARLALGQAIRDGVLRPGDRLPPEQALTEILGVSLGTVQAALRQLQQVGVIVRRRGDGTKVGSTEPLAATVWHFRFAAPEDGTPLHYVDRWARIDVTAERGVWARYLGERDRYVRIRRQFVFGGRPPVGAEMYLDPALAPGLLDLRPDDVAVANIRVMLAERFGVTAVSANHTVRVIRIDARTARALELRPRAQMYDVHAEAFARDRRPVYFQRILVPIREFALTFDGVVTS